MRRLGYVDGLRALAVLGVVVYHASPSTKLDHPDPLGSVLKMGAHGVDLFFVISGFCLAYPYLDRIRRAGSTSFDALRFLAKRLLRILPPYYITVALLAVVARMGLYDYGGEPASSFSGIVHQLFFLDHDLHFLEGPFWTLPIEFRWYFAFPFLLWIYAKSPRGFATLGILSTVCYYFTRQNGLDIGTAASFMLGIWAADLQITQSPLRRFALPVFLPCFVIATLLEPNASQAFYAVEPIGTIALFALVVASGPDGPLNRLLSIGVLRFIGIASYSIYLLNYPIVMWMENTAHLPHWLAFIAGATVPIAFWLCVERPLMSAPLHDRLVTWIEDALRPVAAFVGLPKTCIIAAAPAPATIAERSSISA